MKIITRSIWLLSLVSLFTDVASEMLYPVMPVYLKSIGFSVILIGMLEGIAEATAGLSKGYFGRLSDISGKRTPFVQWGYLLSAISKPLLVVFTYPLWVFFSRTLDRLGKGIRTGARDAVLSDASTKETKARVFGFHRSFDTLGAVLGPSLAMIYLYFHPGNYKILFLVAFLPGLLAVLFTLFLKEPKKITGKTPRVSFLSSFSYWKSSPLLYKKVVGGLLVFALFNSSDMFLLLKVGQAGLPEYEIVGIYIFYNLVYALFSFPLGILADKMGLKTMLVIGLSVFSIVYLGMAGTGSRYVMFGLFFLYGIYAAATEGISKAWISNMVAKEDTATAIGSFSGFQSICALVASSLTGILWYNFGPQGAFYCTAFVTALVIIYLLVFVPNRSRSTPEN
ncbi:MAG: MFS transporter [bacterium]|nr:MFS transporter [bacterium]